MSDRRRQAVLGVTLIIAAVLLAVLPTTDPVLVPRIDRDTIGRHAPLAITPLSPSVSLRAAFVVLLAWAGSARLVLRRRGPLVVVLADLALTAPVTVFLIGLVNGVTDVLALIPLYALTTGAWLLAVLQTRVRVERGHPLLPLCFAAGVGIVPWGVIALAQLTGDPPIGIRVATLVALAGQVVVGALLWRTARAGRAAAADVAAASAIAATALATVLLS